MTPPDDPQNHEEDRPAETGGSAEDRTTLDAAGAPAGDRDLDELLDDPDPASD